MDLSQALFVIFLVGFTATAAVIDLKTRRLPNWLTVPAFFAALLYHGVTGGLAGLGLAMGGFAVGFGTLLVLWLIGGGGGGDVKLMGALGAWLGWKLTLAVFFLSTIFAVLGSILMLSTSAFRDGVEKVRRRYLKSSAAKTKRKPTEEELQERAIRRRLLPYALPVALGTWLVLVYQVVIK